MSDGEGMTESVTAERTMDQIAAEAQSAWKKEAKELAKLAGAIGPLTKPAAMTDMAKLPGLLGKVQTKMRGLSTAARGEELLNELREVLAARRQRLQERLSHDLQEACKAHKLELRVVRRDEPVEVRIPPFAVLIDREKGRAELRFARLAIGSCEASADAIVEAHQAALKEMTGSFDAAKFFGACLGAWRTALSDGQQGSGERVELVRFLQYLALQCQSEAFRVDPKEANYRGYSRAQFAFDLMLLRKHGGLSHGGWRLNLGVATGTTATNKKRTIFIEDEWGEGEFKLTVFFTKTEGE